MKRILALFLALLMALSLAGCSGTGRNVPSDGSEEAANIETPGDDKTGSTDTPSDTPGDGTERDAEREELLESAPVLKKSELIQALDENKVRAEETYLGNSFQMCCSVDEIESDHFNDQTGTIELRVYLSRDELKELNRGEVINIVGTIDSFETETESWPDGVQYEQDVINMKTAYYVDNTVYGIFIIETFLTEDGQKTCIAKPVQMLCDLGVKNGYRIFLDEETTSKLEQQDFIFVSGTAYVVDKTSVGPYSYLLELRNAELIVKGQDEIAAYFEKMDEELAQKLEQE